MGKMAMVFVMFVTIRVITSSGERANKHPHPTPFVADNEIDLHQYFNMSVEIECILPQVEMEKGSII